ncbi:MAG TPA: Fic family protein [Chryseolinea sp.]|nr:Fic family protein [Chryseolinea sp.]
MNYKIPSVELSSELKEDLSRIEKIIDDLNTKRDEGLSKELLDNLKRQLLIKQVYHSNAIEGNKLSLRETELILNGMVINERPLKDEIEAKSLANATEYLYSLIDGREPLTKRTLLELHSLILKNSPNGGSGVFRKHDVQIKGSEHKPPSHLSVEEHVDELFQWMNRNSHKFPPMIMGSILHHWMTWIHPFSDGNGRVSRLFLNFFLLQKGYPEVIVKLVQRDQYYNSLIAADKGSIAELIELLADNITETISAYEELINEDQRQKDWLKKYKDLRTEEYTKVKSKHSYDYEVWKNQMAVFKTLFKKSLQEISAHLSNIEVIYKDYDVISLNQYLDLLEDRSVSNSGYMYVSLYDRNKHESLTLVFYFERLYVSRRLKFEEEQKRHPRNFKTRKVIPPAIKLHISGRKNGVVIKLNESVDLVNIGTYKDQLSFGIVDRSIKREPWQKPRIESRTDAPGEVIRRFIDQILQLYFEIKPNKKAQ